MFEIIVLILTNMNCADEGQGDAADGPCVQPAASYGDEWAQLRRLQSLLSSRDLPHASINIKQIGREHVATVHVGRLVLGHSLPWYSEKDAVKDVVQVVLTAFDAFLGECKVHGENLIGFCIDIYKKNL